MSLRFSFRRAGKSSPMLKNLFPPASTMPLKPDFTSASTVDKSFSSSDPIAFVTPLASRTKATSPLDSMTILCMGFFLVIDAILAPMLRVPNGCKCIPEADFH
jgi:hypothetical protein